MEVILTVALKYLKIDTLLQKENMPLTLNEQH